MLQEGDAEELFAVVDANRAHLREWLPWVDASTEVGHILQFVRSVLEQHSKNDGFACAVLCQRRIVGVAAYHPIRWANRSVELGYWLSRDMVGKGMITRSCSVLTDHAFRELGLNRVAVQVATNNFRSRAVPERLGFKQEGIIRDAEWLYDHFVDHVLYAVLRREWQDNDLP
jgi:ribosomal-protein-serine acetyltransferase